MWQALSCPRQVAYDMTGTLGLLLRRPNLRSAMGRCAHAVVRSAEGRSFTSDDFDAAWSADLERERVAAARPSIGPIPDPITWPNYWITYERLHARLVTTGREPARQPPLAARPGATPWSAEDLPLIEKRLRDRIRKIVGTPDLVYRDADGRVTIRDYKSGIGLSPDGESAQLHLYAHILEASTGMAAQVGEIDRLRGVPERQEIQPDRVADVVHRTLEARNAVLAKDVEGAASSGTCLWCSYRLLCSKAVIGEDIPSVGDIVGVVAEAITTPEGRLSALLLTNDGATTALGGLEGRDLSVEVGEVVIVVGSRGRALSGGLLADWSTVVVTEHQVDSAVDGHRA